MVQPVEDPIEEPAVDATPDALLTDLTSANLHAHATPECAAIAAAVVVAEYHRSLAAVQGQHAATVATLQQNATAIDALLAAAAVDEEVPGEVGPLPGELAGSAGAEVVASG